MKGFLRRLDTSLTIIQHSFGIMRRHPKLLVYPAINLLATFLAYQFYFQPQFERMSETMREQGPGAGGWQGAPYANSSESFFQFAVFYLLGMFVTTFFNVAIYSQIIAAMNGGRVSIKNGFVLAFTKVRAIAAWSLFAGTVGLVLRFIQERVGPLGRWLTGLAGISWSAASVFVIPVIINEPTVRRPLDYLKISTTLARRVWGEGIIAITGVMMFVLLVLVLGFVGFGIGTFTGGSPLPVRIVYGFAIASTVMFMVGYLAWQIFECGLYVYATEGVAPGSFDEELFSRAWVVGKGTAPESGRPVERRRSWWLKLRILVPAMVACLAVLWFVRPKPPQPVVPAGPEVGLLKIDLSLLEHSLEFAHLQAAGLFADQVRVGCGFPPEAERVGLRESVDGLMRVSMMRQGDQLYFTFFDQDEAAGRARIRDVRDALRSRFPGRELAIDLAQSIPYVPRTTVAKWNADPGAASYTFELDCFHCCGNNRWCTEVGSKWKIEPGLRESSRTFDWVGSQPGRWRVWSVDANGRAGPKSEWTGFDYSYKACGTRQ